MAANRQTRSLFQEQPGDGTVFINSRCRIQTMDGYRLVIVSGVVLAHYLAHDRMSEAYAMVSLIEQGWARQKEVAHAFGRTDRTLRRYQQRFEKGGLSALGRTAGYPRGRPRLARSRKDKIERWISEGVSRREIARRLGVTDRAVRKILWRLGWKNEQKEQLEFPAGGADPKLSAFSPPTNEQLRHRPVDTVEKATGSAKAGADPNVSAFSPEPDWSLSMDPDPADRSVDRLLACMGLLDDAKPRFRAAKTVSGAGVLLAIPALIHSGVFDITRQVYGSIGPAFYGLRTTIATFLLMALLRIKRAEGLKERSPEQLGCLLGLDRAMEVKTLRKKLSRLATVGRATELGRALAEHRVRTRGQALGFLYVDGHVRVYHGKRKVPKAHVARMRLPMPATTDYWVHDAEGEPLFLVNTEANRGLVKMLPQILAEVRQLVGDRRVTVVFDRGGWSPRLFRRLITSGFDILTYRKGRCRKIPKSRFISHEETFDGHTVRYLLADQNVLLDKRKLKLRQVTRLCDNGHQTPIITSRCDLSAIEVAHRMFERWRQENFFKYLREEYALDALVDYGTEPADPDRDVPNPQRKKLDAELRKAHTRLIQLQAEYGFEAFTNQEQLRRTMRGFKIAHASLNQDLFDAIKKVIDLERKRAAVPRRVPVNSITSGDVIKLQIERKLLTDLFKMVAYQAESELVRLISPTYRRVDDEGRTLIQNALLTAGDLEVTDTELTVSLHPLNSPHRTQVLDQLCEQLNQTKTHFPGTKLRLRFEVLPLPETCMAFPGPRPAQASKADILGRG